MRYAKNQVKNRIPLSLMYLYRLFILWKAEIHSPGGHLRMNGKSIFPRTKGNKASFSLILSHQRRGK